MCSVINNFILWCRITSFFTKARKVIIMSGVIVPPWQSVCTRVWAVFFHSRATANFLFKNSHLVTIATARCRSGVGLNFNGTIKLCNTLVWCYIHVLSVILANFVLKFPNFRCHGNEGRSGVACGNIVKLPDLDNPSLVQHSCLCLLY